MPVAAVLLLVATHGRGDTQQRPEEASRTAAMTSPPSAVPTTRILAIGRLARPRAPGDRERIMPREVAATLRLYLKGYIADWYVRTDRAGVVLLLNLADVQEAHRMLDTLPLGVARLMTFELVPLGPLAPLALLDPARPRDQ